MCHVLAVKRSVIKVTQMGGYNEIEVTKYQPTKDPWSAVPYTVVILSIVGCHSTKSFGV